MNNLQELLLTNGPPFRSGQVPVPAHKDIAQCGNMGIKPGFGEQYPFLIMGEPVPKSTTRPPKGNAYMRVMTDPKFKALARTWLFQDKVAGAAFDCGIPVFDPEDPIWMDCFFYLGDRRVFDRKNGIAAIEDGLGFGGFIHNDRQITGGMEMMNYNCPNPRVYVVLRLDERIMIPTWLVDTLGSKEKAKAYYQKLGYGVRNCSACGNPFPNRDLEVVTCSCTTRAIFFLDPAPGLMVQ